MVVAHLHIHWSLSSSSNANNLLARARVPPIMWIGCMGSCIHGGWSLGIFMGHVTGEYEFLE